MIRKFQKFNFKSGVRRYLHQKRSSRVDVMHQIVTLHISLQCWRERDCASVVYQNVNTAKLFKNENKYERHVMCGSKYNRMKICTFLTAFCTAVLTCCSSRTSTIQGNALPPASSTVNKTILIPFSHRIDPTDEQSQLTFFRGRIDCAWQFRVRFGCFGRNHHICSITGCFQCN